MDLLNGNKKCIGLPKKDTILAIVFLFWEQLFQWTSFLGITKINPVPKKEQLFQWTSFLGTTKINPVPKKEQLSSNGVPDQDVDKFLRGQPDHSPKFL